MEIDELLWCMGGVATRRQLLEHVSPHELRTAVQRERLVRIGHGLYGLPGLEDAVVAARSLNGVLSHTSAALHHGWAVKSPPRLPHVTVPRSRKVAPERRRGVTLHYADDVRADGVATAPEQTVVDCARRLPFDEALSVADSALRAGVGRQSLLRAAERSPRTRRGQALAVVEAADGRAENPFESVIRAISLEFAVRLEPQVSIPGYGRADLCDRRLGLIVECDSFTFHSERIAVVKDVERYNSAAILGSSLLRFAWEHSMSRQDYVRDTFREWLAVRSLTDGLAVGGRCPHCAA